MIKAFKLDELRSDLPSLRISPELDVPITHRVKSLIDCAVFRRLSRISQLGLVSLVYPGATHTRFEHSLGVYRNAILFVNQLQSDPLFNELIDEYAAKCFLLAALLHDIGHWPFCHAIEDIKLDGVAKHETLARSILRDSELVSVIRDQWEVDPKHVSEIIAPQQKNSDEHFLGFKPSQILQSMLSGPIDIDKLDYLERDSLHAGVPYGRNFDRNRLIKSLCLAPDTFKLSITEKGKTAAEMMVFARYIMFSEVYWHHAVRSATAMLQRAIFEISVNQNSKSGNGVNFSEEARHWLSLSEFGMMDRLLGIATKSSWGETIRGIFGSKRALYKRVFEIDCLSYSELHNRFARRPYSELVLCANELARLMTTATGSDVSPGDILIDAPPQKLEVQFQIDVKTRDGRFRRLGELSPMVHSLATKQFDDIVKRVRVFVHPRIAQSIANLRLDWPKLMSELDG